MKMTRSSLIVILIALFVLAAGVVQMIAQGADSSRADKDDCCPDGKAPDMAAPAKDIPSACPASESQPAEPGPHSKCPYAGEK